MLLFSCEIVPNINFHPHGAVVVLEKLIELVQLPLVIHKHNVPYIIWHIITTMASSASIEIFVFKFSYSIYSE